MAKLEWVHGGGVGGERKRIQESQEGEATSALSLSLARSLSLQHMASITRDQTVVRVRHGLNIGTTLV